MVGRFQPYLYDAPVDDSTFNPKAVTMASRMPPSPPKKKQEGPLIDFNKHPDSYLILPYGNTNAKPMNKKTKTFIKIARWVQLFFRVCTLLGAVGVLLCSIFIRGTTDTEGYIMRIPPGADLVICLYAIYHLVRNAKSRPPGSSASYHFFALVTDAGFIPFYVFTVLLSRRNSDMEAGTVGRWRTMFPTDEETNKVLLTTWLTSVAVAGLHLISLFLDMYLLVIFRKIAKLPPDMNPLEDNLTSRRKTKHKHKNSSISALTPLTGDQEKRFSNLSSQSTVPGDRLSQMDPLISRDIPSPHKHQVAFMHTRTNSDMTYSPHTPHSARQSKERFSMYSQPATAHQSRRDLNHRDDLHKRDDMDDNETLAQRKSMLAQQANIKRHARAESYITNSSKENFYTPPATARSDKQPGAGDHSLQRNSRETLQNDNWFVHPDEENAPEPEQQYAAPATAKQSMFSTNNQSNQGYNTLSPYDDDVSDVEQEYELDQAMAPQPLRMNPPTPPPAQIYGQQKKHTPPPELQRTKTTTSISTDATFNRSHSQSRGGTPKSRYYGDLAAATNGVRSGASPANSPSTSPSKPSYRTQQPNHFPSATKQYISNTPPPSSHSPVKASPFTLDKKSYTSVRRTGDIGYQPVKGQSPRVVSRSGVDYINPYEFDDSDIATGRRRDVSGKVAEEGRGGWGMGGMTFRKISGMA
ncbi:hypothetical protein HBI56_138390 [Parastagonospora nodorum]|nr:hypothetical protein HBH51_116110 [Parastagonospora nodorum]KAH3996521.1 hypothetical protein HBI10_157480 [Parastagonospora nodorum]KAH4018962.1 hypothetical protein HBI13_128560 [Parastagonospora nodorum]KAH4345234.1 hypothetical protein HBH98_125650 [Parastagonospora nodorum]KAH4374993.1 hypothetical protein HBH97_122800 [Parastagonospora nodorum]